MNIYHKLDWNKCLSHEIWESFKKGWPESDEEVHFFWGLAGKNVSEIQKCMDENKKWFYVDVGYFTEQITRYPEPKINNYDKTYFRIVHQNLHTITGSVGTGERLSELESKGINVEFKGWETGGTKHILVCPSSQMVTHTINGMNQDEWIKQTIEDIRTRTNREIKVRNKPRPGNEFWGTDIKDSLKGAHCLVTNMSLSAIDAVMNMTPVICDVKNVCYPISKKLENIENAECPSRKDFAHWLKIVAENQFTIPEIESGKAFEVFKKQL